MSRADWSFLEHLLEEGQAYSTAVGRVWLTVLFLFRMLVLGTAAESAWDDEQADFVCNTRQPGCTSVCYDRAFPISHFRYFVLQVIFVSTPTIFYFGYVAMKASQDNSKELVKDENQGEDAENCDGEVEMSRKNADQDLGKGKDRSSERNGKDDKPSPEAPKLKGAQLGAYAFSILLKILLEGGFIVGLWFLYGGFFIAAKFECTRSPCPHTVDCFVSRPTEKTIFTIYTQAIAAISLLLNIVELLHLLQLAISQRLEKRYEAQRQEYFPQTNPAPAQAPAELQLEAPPEYNAESPSETVSYRNPSESQGDITVEINRRPGDADSDLLPTFMNYMGALRTTHSPQIHYKKHTKHINGNPKSIGKRSLKHKQYV
ncbi:gap junction alpha-4 protein [Gouania willdenowi]|uniref:Gap junction protein n=1 Tax=Gouania willdenowi TaxID=441366 RepID=A0A8C5EJB0_GOUWI|nr:gap junction alpha-4 protein-like [Gouania willdenowi]